MDGVLIDFSGLLPEVFANWAIENDLAYTLVSQMVSITGYGRGLLSLAPVFTIWLDDRREVEVMLTWSDYVRSN